MSQLRECEYWSDYPAAGGIRLGNVVAPTVLSISPSVDGNDECEIGVPEAIATVIPSGYVIRSEDTHGTFYEFRVRRRRRVLGNTHRVLVGQGPLADLATCGPITRSASGQTSLDVAGIYTVTEWIDDVILPYLATRGITHWTRGTVDFVEQVEVAAVPAGRTPLALLRELQTQTGGELRAVAVGLTGYQIGFYRRVGSTAPTIVVEIGRSLLTLNEDEDDESLVTTVVPQGAIIDATGLPSNIGENAWIIDGTVLGAKAYVFVKDPAGGAGPVAFTGQYTGYYLLKSDGTTEAILDGADIGLNTSALEVASLTGFTAGEHVQIVADAAGTRLYELANPNYTTRQIVKVQSTPLQRGERNLLLNPFFTAWTNVTTPERWAAAGGTCSVGRYERTEPATQASMVANGAQSIGNTYINFRGATAGARFYLNEYFVISQSGYGGAFRVGDTVVVADGSGNGTINFRYGATTGANILDGATLVMFGQAPKRPSTFPTERQSESMMRLLTESAGALPPAASAVRMQSEALTIKYIGGPLAQVNVAAAFTCHNGSAAVIGNRDSSSAISEESATIVTRHLPGLMLVDSTPTRLTYGFVLPSVPVNGTIHNTAICSYTLTADKRVSVALLGGHVDLWVGCRWVALWLGDAAAPLPIAFAQANKLLQRGNRELVARQLAARAVSLTFYELANALGYMPSAETVQLGGDIALSNIGITGRIMRLKLDFINPEQSRVSVDTRAPDLIRFLSERM